MREGGGEGRIKVALAPIFAPLKSEKCLERAEKPTETLTTQANALGSNWFNQNEEYLLIHKIVFSKSAIGRIQVNFQKREPRKHNQFMIVLARNKRKLEEKRPIFFRLQSLSILIIRNKKAPIYSSVHWESSF